MDSVNPTAAQAHHLYRAFLDGLNSKQGYQR